MAGVTDTQSIRFGTVADPIDWTTVRDEADDIATQLDLADAQAVAALQMPGAIVRRGAALALAVTTVVLLPFDSEQWDTHAMVDIPGQPSRLTASATAGAGLYYVSVQVQCDTTGWTRGDLIVNKNGAQYCRRNWLSPAAFGYMQAGLHIWLGTVGDYVSFSLYHEGGGTTNLVEAFAHISKLANN